MKKTLLAATCVITGIAKIAIGVSCIETGAKMIAEHESATDVVFGGAFVIVGGELAASSAVSVRNVSRLL